MDSMDFGLGRFLVEVRNHRLQLPKLGIDPRPLMAQFGQVAIAHGKNRCRTN